MSRVRYAVEATAFRAMSVLSHALSWRALGRLGKAAGSLGYLVDRRHRKIALENLRQAYGEELDERDRRRIARACWRHFGRITMEAFAFPRLSPQSVGRRVRYEGLEHIREAYRRGHGVVLFSAHYGNWELVALMQGHLEMPLSLVTRPLDNPSLERMLARIRSLSGNVIIHKRRAVREMLRVLQSGGGVAIVIDQDARRSGVFVPFFHRPASTTPTAALLALRTGATVVPVFSVPLRDGSYRVVYEPAVEVTRTGNREADVRGLTATMTAVVETWVRRHPECWLWMHRRWKTRPPVTESGS